MKQHFRNFQEVLHYAHDHPPQYSSDSERLVDMFRSLYLGDIYYAERKQPYNKWFFDNGFGLPGRFLTSGPYVYHWCEAMSLITQDVILPEDVMEKCRLCHFLFSSLESLFGFYGLEVREGYMLDYSYRVIFYQFMFNPLLPTPSKFFDKTNYDPKLLIDGLTLGEQESLILEWLANPEVKDYLIFHLNNPEFPYREITSIMEGGKRYKIQTERFVWGENYIDLDVQCAQGNLEIEDIKAILAEDERERCISHVIVNNMEFFLDSRDDTFKLKPNWLISLKP